MRVTRRWTIPLLVLAALGAAAAQDRPSQDQPSQDPALSRAILLEEGERDLTGAEAAYKQIADNSRAAAATRTMASLRLGQLLQRLGRLEESRAALAAAARGEGAAAQRARSLLEGKQDPGGERLDTRVQKAVQGLRDPDQGVWGPARAELEWIGWPAVPFLAAQIEAETVDLAFVTRATGALSAIGGPEAGRFFERVAQGKDTLFKRAVLRGVPHLPQESALSKGLRALAEDEDAQVRAEALSKVRRSFDEPELLALARDPLPQARVIALSEIVDRLGREPAAPRDGILDALRAALDDDDGEVRAVAASAFDDSRVQIVLGRSRKGMELYFDSLGRRGRTPHMFGALVADDVVLPSATLVEAARRLDRAALPALASVVDRVAPRWRNDALADVIELARLRAFGSWSPSAWLVAHARPADAPALAAHLAHASDPQAIVKWLNERGRGQAVFEPLRAWYEARLEAKDYSGSFSEVSRTLAMLGTEEADRYLVDVARRRPELADHLASHLLGRDPSPDDALLELVRQGLDTMQPGTRNMLLAHLLLAGRAEAVELLPGAYALGLSQSSLVKWSPKAGGGSYRALAWLAAQDQPSRTPLCALPAAEVARAFALCLATRQPHVWEDTSGILRWWGQHRLPAEALATISERALDCPEPGKRQALVQRLLGLGELHVESARALALRCLEHGDAALRLTAVESMTPPVVGPAVREKILALLGDADIRVVIATARVLGSATLDHEAIERLGPLLSHSHPSVRAEVIGQLASLGRPQAAELLLPMLDDREWPVRKAACEAAGILVDRRAIPGLLRALRDRQEAVRTAAKTALESIRFYIDQTERWQRILDQSPLEATSAAEALLAQAKRDQPKKTRLAAIASLGSLGVAETLPVLIAMMAEDDAEIAAAAAAAVEKINARK